MTNIMCFVYVAVNEGRVVEVKVPRQSGYPSRPGPRNVSQT